MRSITLLLMVFGLSLAPASGATLWMQFEGGGNVATLAPSDSINVEIWVDLLPGDSLGALWYTNWPYDGPENPGTMNEPIDYPYVEGLVQTHLTAIATDWSAQAVNGLLGFDDGQGLQQVAFSTTSNFLGAGSYLIGVQTIHHNQIKTFFSEYFNGSIEYDFYPIMFGGDPGSLASTLRNSAGAGFTFDPRYAGSYVGYYTWGQGGASLALGKKWMIEDNPLRLYSGIPEPASLALLALGGLALIRRR